MATLPRVRMEGVRNWIGIALLMVHILDGLLMEVCNGNRT